MNKLLKKNGKSSVHCFILNSAILLSGGMLAWLSGMRCRRAKGHRLPECLVCNRHQWARQVPGARKITSIVLRRSTGGSSASRRPPCLTKDELTSYCGTA